MQQLNTFVFRMRKKILHALERELNELFFFCYLQSHRFEFICLPFSASSGFLYSLRERWCARVTCVVYSLYEWHSSPPNEIPLHSPLSRIRLLVIRASNT